MATVRTGDAAGEDDADAIEESEDMGVARSGARCGARNENGRRGAYALATVAAA
jgi:hypothetical protein